MNLFVTGGSRGIGREIVLKTVSEGNGCAFTYVENKAAAEETLALAKNIDAEVSVKAYQMNLKDPAAIEEICDRAVDDFGKIDAVVNNAAIVKNNAAALMSNEEWYDVLQVDLSGPFFVMRSFLMHFLGNKQGRFVSISSLAQCGSSGQANYSAAKAGLTGLTKAIAKEYATKGVTSNAIIVGYVETDMSKEHMSKELHEAWIRVCPAKRIGTAAEIANVVHFLVSEDSVFVNGEEIHVTGGLTYAS